MAVKNFTLDAATDVLSIFAQCSTRTIGPALNFVINPSCLEPRQYQLSSGGQTPRSFRSRGISIAQIDIDSNKRILLQMKIVFNKANRQDELDGSISAFRSLTSI